MEDEEWYDETENEEHELFEMDEDQDYYEYVRSKESLLLENLQNCIVPTVRETFNHFLLNLLIVNILLKVFLFFNREFNPWRTNQIEHLAVISAGSYLLLQHYNESTGVYLHWILWPIFLMFLFLHKANFRLNLVWIVCVFAIALNEILNYKKSTMFSRLRPVLMLYVMKCVSLASPIRPYTLLEQLAYLLHPQCLPLGGWSPIEYKKTPKTVADTFILHSRPIFLCFIFLIFANCTVHYFMGLMELYLLPIVFAFTPLTIYKLCKGLLNAYFVALQFRCSHYFISYTMQFLHVLWDYDLNVTIPLHIEFPRSLVEVVIVWNQPMHIWLKSHLYEPLAKRNGKTFARILTFTLSAFMHGANFQIFSVLVTLSMLTWLEMRYREKLSNIFDACIASRACENIKSKKKSTGSLNASEQVITCPLGHKNTASNSWLVCCVNFLFTLLAIAHLAFLGSAFDGNENSATFEHVWDIWSYLGFYSHIIFLINLIIYMLI